MLTNIGRVPAKASGGRSRDLCSDRAPAAIDGHDNPGHEGGGIGGQEDGGPYHLLDPAAPAHGSPLDRLLDEGGIPFPWRRIWRAAAWAQKR